MEKIYMQYKNLLFTLAYQLTGSATDAEDVVQDVFLKVKALDLNLECLAEPKAYLCRMTVNRCRDMHKSARKRREQYFGEWLPEPISTAGDELFESVAREELLSYAMLVLLERLSSAERTVFVLREALGFNYPAIAELIDKSESNCRKLISRARSKMGIIDDETFLKLEAESEEWVHRFLSVLEQGNIDGVIAMLHNDVVLISDGGGKANAAVHPIVSRDYVARFLIGLSGKKPLYEQGIQVELKIINGQTGLTIHSNDGLTTVVLMHVERNLIQNIYFIRNPDKLLHI
ncbi:RNA polymerase sigma factor SigJ [Paenibacillus sp. 19GGS1-52]|uniref:RNA polymerase sigma factor SigJ n=1 Tax=Paenibacillus sp. 19GGS1-52 TaxID=2758563 RepID=UPI001EFB677F|nr:RNA polymerase sigma factor SigJ [Paenibacillus sp. 19GGS1-52]ULO07104.1 RNA polymerase sigma factor SigJ [Paenibacillus sp. 19GGS1-52]